MWLKLKISFLITNTDKELFKAELFQYFYLRVSMKFKHMVTQSDMYVPWSV